MLNNPDNQAYFPADPYLSTEAAAEMLGVSTRWIRYLIKTKKLDAKKEGKVWRITRASALAYESTRQPPGNPNWIRPQPRKKRLQRIREVLKGDV